MNKPTITTLLMAGSLLFFPYFGGIPALMAAEEAIPVTLMKPSLGTVAQIEKTTGKLLAVRRAGLQMKSKGTIERMFVKEGDRVKQGQILASLEKKTFQLGMDQAQSLGKAVDSQVKAADAAVTAASTGVQQAEVRLQTVSRDYGRAKCLREKDTIPQQQFDQIEGQYKLAVVGLEAAKDQLVLAKAGFEVAQAQTTVTQVGLRTAQHHHDEANLIAPFDGLIVEKLVQENEPCGDSTLYQLVDDSELELTFRLSERFLPVITPGTRLLIRSPLAPEPISATISTIIPAIDQKSLSFAVKAIIPNSEHRLSHGGYADVDVIIKEDQGIPIIPTGIVKITDDLTGTSQENARPGYVFTVRDGKAHKTPVTVGISRNNHVSILSGLASGTPIVDRGFGQLDDGTPVTIASEADR